jgi:hypothetical protein
MGTVFDELLAREPLFHREPDSAGRHVFERMTAPDYWEVGASGRVYDREFIIETLVKRHSGPQDDEWVVEDFAVRQLSAEAWLATYELHQGQRRSRRSTVWARTDSGWVALYHQGTLC